MIWEKELLAICPRVPRDKAAEYAEKLSEAMAEAEALTLTRAAAFLGQWALETGDFRWLTELATGEAYEGRRNLGNTQPGDGRRFKGRGVCQLTGRANYAAFSQALGVDFLAQPELVSTPAYAFRAAAWYWNNRNLNKYADALDFRGLTRAINGGYNHLDRRLAYYHKALEVLGLTANV